MICRARASIDHAPLTVGLQRRFNPGLFVGRQRRRLVFERLQDVAAGRCTNSTTQEDELTARQSSLPPLGAQEFPSAISIK